MAPSHRSGTSKPHGPMRMHHVRIPCEVYSAVKCNLKSFCTKTSRTKSCLQAKMADSGATGCEMEDQGYSPVTLLEDSYTVYENYASMHKFNVKGSPFYRLSEKIRGTYFIILNYFSTFHEFSSTAEALNLTFTSLDCIEQTRKISQSDEE